SHQRGCSHLFSPHCRMHAKSSDDTKFPKKSRNPQKEVIYTSNETLVTFVEIAATYVKIHGKEKALEEFNNPNGSFIQGEIYIHAYDFNGTTLAHPVNPEKVGKNLLDEEATGIFVKEMGDIVRN